MKLPQVLFWLLALVFMAALGFAAPTIPFNASASHIVLVGDEIVQNDRIHAISRLMFETSLHDFLEARNATDPTYVDWYSNGCNSSPDHPFGVDFVKGCNRHDFGYQNFRAINRWNPYIRKEVDLNFRQDLFEICEEQQKISQPICYGIAEIYYLAVRAFGGDGNSRSRNVTVVEEDGAIILQVDGVEKHRVDHDTVFWGSELWMLGVQDTIEEDEMLGLS